jgi:membrane associated rhomboid family serine protease
MFFLLPVPPDKGYFPPVVTSLVVVCSIAFLITWPMQQSQQGVTSQDYYQSQAKGLVDLLLRPSSGLAEADHQRLEAAVAREPFPDPEVLAIIEQVQSTAPPMLSSEGQYRWSTAYPLFHSVQQSYDQNPKAASVFERLGFQPKHSWWPGLITHQFLHAGWMHVIFNMLFLWVAGAVLEEVLGLGLLILFLLSGIVAAFGQAYSGLANTQVLVGASGGISGLMGFALTFMPAAHIRLFYLSLMTLAPRFGTFESPLWFCIPLWLLQQVFMLLMSFKGPLGSVGYAAHVSGFAFGAIIGLCLRQALPRPPS